jgi:hypothetical protein
LEFKHLNDARKLVRTFFVPVNLIGHPHFGHLIGDLLATPWQEYATARRWASPASVFSSRPYGVVVSLDALAV